MNSAEQTVYRILDASANRASEGLRTIEEYVRFGLNDAQDSSALKQLRHDLAEALARLDRNRLLSARDTESDVGTRIATESEYAREELSDVIAAAAERVQQSLRVLEEYGKTIDVGFASRTESIRYRAYQVTARIALRASSESRLARLRESVLYLLIDCQRSEDAFVRSIRMLADAGVDLFQLRDKQATDRQLFERAKAGAAVASSLGVLFLVNDRADIAVAAGADGVHVGQDELPVREAKRVVGPSSIVGVSTHRIEQVHQAIADGADYLGCGPTFPSQTKSFASHSGTEFLKRVHEETRQTPRPAFAIGGIDLGNVDQVTACGFHRIAVTAAIQSSDDPVDAAKRLRDRLKSVSAT